MDESLPPFLPPLHHALSAVSIVSSLASTLLLLCKPPSKIYRRYLLAVVATSVVSDVVVNSITMLVPLPPLPCVAVESAVGGSLPTWTKFLVGTAVWLVSLSVAVGGASVVAGQATVAEPSSTPSAVTARALLSLLFLLSTAIPVAVFCNVSESDAIRTRLMQEQFSGWTDPQRVVCLSSLGLLVFLMSSTIVIVISIVLMLVLSLFLVAPSSAPIHPNRRRLQKTMAERMLAQALVPLICILLPLCVFVGCYLFSWVSPALSTACVCLMGQQSLMQSLLLVVSTPTYRSFFLRPCVTPQPNLDPIVRAFEIKTRVQFDTQIIFRSTLVCFPKRNEITGSEESVGQQN